MYLPILNVKFHDGPLGDLPNQKLLIATINAHSYNIAQLDHHFSVALKNSDVILPDGISIVWAVRLLTGQKLKKIAGYDLFTYEMNRLNRKGGTCFFLGSSKSTLQRIVDRAKLEYPHITVFKYSPPYNLQFSEEDNAKMIQAINKHEPEVLFIGMTAPKQEKWAYDHFDELKVGHVCAIGAVFDFYAGTVKRAPQWMISLGFEWLYRLIQEPRRMWRRYLVGNVKFISAVLGQSFKRFIPL